MMARLIFRLHKIENNCQNTKEHRGMWIQDL